MKLVLISWNVPIFYVGSSDIAFSKLVAFSSVVKAARYNLGGVIETGSF
jgi:hypothetical protein